MKFPNVFQTISTYSSQLEYVGKLEEKPVLKMRFFLDDLPRFVTFKACWLANGGKVKKTYESDTAILCDAYFEEEEAVFNVYYSDCCLPIDSENEIIASIPKKYAGNFFLNEILKQGGSFTLESNGKEIYFSMPI